LPNYQAKLACPLVAAMAHVSNVLGTVNPIAEAVEAPHHVGAYMLA
jgi:selenocysteine lyase/cysteine desulfurase